MVAIFPSLTKDYIYLNDRIIAWHESASNSTVSLLFSDPIGYPLLAINATGTVLWKGEGKAFGDMWQSTLSGGTQPDNRFPGQWIQRPIPTSTDTQLFDNGMRVYSTQKGRYTQPDPLMYFPYRYFGEMVGRFISENPTSVIFPTYESTLDAFVRTGLSNYYPYAYNSPTSFVDPNGEQAVQGVRAVVTLINVIVQVITGAKVCPIPTQRVPCLRRCRMKIYWKYFSTRSLLYSQPSSCLSL